VLFIVIGCLLQNLFIEESFISSEHYLSRPCQIRIYIINGFITTKFNSKTVLLSWMVFMVFISCHNHPIIHVGHLSMLLCSKTPTISVITLLRTTTNLQLFNKLGGVIR
jgi:hypothetical protein